MKKLIDMPKQLDMLPKRPNGVYMLVFLWLSLCIIFFMWGFHSLITVIDIPSWEDELRKAVNPDNPQAAKTILSILYFGFLTSAIVWLVFSFIFMILAYASFLGRSWVWTIGLIFSTIFLVIFGLMLASFMITAWLFPTRFTIEGLITVVLSILIDLGLIYHLTRKKVRGYFHIEKDKSSIQILNEIT